MPGYYFYGIDFYYLILIIPAIIISLIAQARVKSTFAKYSSQNTLSHITGAQAAERVLRANGVSNVRIERVSGSLTDHFDPKSNVIRLSESVYDQASVAAVGVAAHEAGHAVQYAQGYAPIKLRNAFVPVVNFGSSFSWILLLMGFLFSFEPLILAGVICFGLVTVFHLLTLPVEFNASSRALSAIKDSNILYDDRELKGARSVLSAAAMTYVAALILSLAQLLRLLLIFGKRRR